MSFFTASFCMRFILYAPHVRWVNSVVKLLSGISILAARISTLIHDILVRTPDFFVATFIQLPIPVSSGRARRGTDWSPDSRAFFRHLCALAPFLHQMFSVSGHPLSVRHRQRPDPPQHVAEQPPGQMPFRQQEPAGASSTVRASPAGPRFSPVAAGDS